MTRKLIPLLLILSLLLIPAAASAQGNTPGEGYTYVVERGDSWLGLAWRTGISVAELKAANPTVRHPNDWLWRGDRLLIPARSGATPGTPGAGGYSYVVKLGDSWITLARDTGISVSELRRANAALLSPKDWLYMGQTVWIPAARPATATPPGTAGALPTLTPLAPTATVSGTLKLPTPTPTVSSTLTLPTPTPTISGTLKLPTPTPTVSGTLKLPTPTPTVSGTLKLPTPGSTPITSTLPGGCPAGVDASVDASAAYLSRPNITSANLKAWLTGCGLLTDKQGSLTEAALQGRGSKDLIMVLRDPAGDQLGPRDALAIFHGGSGGYKLAHQFAGTGAVTLLRAGDINGDGKADAAWTDTTCGAHTCVSTLFVVSWDGQVYRDWIAAEPSMAYGEYTFRNTLPGGSGDEILVHGGMFGSVGAGPQRAWTETWASVEDQPYQMVSQVYDPSACLYHRILDANRALAGWNKAGFEPAITAYTAALDDKAAVTCGSIADELATLRDFARFRLIVAYIGAGKVSQAEALLPQMVQPGLRGAAETFLKSHKLSGSAVQACRDTDRYAAGTPSAWQFLADWGYANPSFTAAELCPLDD